MPGDPLTLARLCHKRVKISESTVVKSLEGDYRPEHVFALRQSLTAYHYYQQLVLETDQEIQRQMVELKTADNALAKMPKRTKRLQYQRQGNLRTLSSSLGWSSGIRTSQRIT